MKWVTRERPKTDRIACPWLIRKFIDPDAEILYVARDEVLVVAEREGAHSFDAPGAEYTHRGSKCSFETLIDEFDLGGGLEAIGSGGLDVEDDDHRLLERGSFVYDALYAWCKRATA